jgi:hypothetical protein
MAGLSLVTWTFQIVSFVRLHLNGRQFREPISRKLNEKVNHAIKPGIATPRLSELIHWI